MAIRNINRNVRGQIVSYPIAEEGVSYGNVYFVDKDDGSQTKAARYPLADVVNNFDIEIKELSFPQRNIVPNQLVQQRARMGAELGSIYLDNPFTTIVGSNQIPWPPIATLTDGTLLASGYGLPGDQYPTPQPIDEGEQIQEGSGQGNQGGGGNANTGGGGSGTGGNSQGYLDSDSSAGGGTMTGGIFGLGGGGDGYGDKIICNELYRQGFLSEEMWDADERYGAMMFEKDPKLVIGYQMWARSVVKFMKKKPEYSKLSYWFFKPWTEYMAYKMGVIEKPSLLGKLTNWIGTQFSYMVFNLYDGQKLLDRYNQRLTA